jgi:hypothetical protein
VSADAVETFDAVEAEADGDVDDGDVDEVVDDVIPLVEPVDDEELEVCAGVAAACLVVLLSEWCTV